MRTKHWVRLGIAVGLLCVEASALGQTAADKKKADDLFAEAMELGEKGDFAAACPKLEEVHALDPTDGTLFSLAKCHEQAGKLATALWYYRTYLETYETLAPNMPEKRVTRVAMAKASIEALKVQVPKLKLIWRGNIPSDVKIAVSGVDALPQLNTEWPLDPGEYLVVVERGGREEPPHAVTLENDKPAVKVDLTPVVVITAPKSTNTTAEKPLATPKPLATNVPISAAQSNSQRGLGIAAIGVGGTAMVAGGVLGILALVEKNTTDNNCVTSSTGKMCTPIGFDAANNGRVFGNAATLPLFVGGALVVTGVVLVSRGTKSKSNMHASVNIDHGAVITVGGTF